MEVLEQLIKLYLLVSDSKLLQGRQLSHHQVQPPILLIELYLLQILPPHLPFKLLQHQQVLHEPSLHRLNRFLLRRTLILLTLSTNLTTTF